jgi:hypothetical protein
MSSVTADFDFYPRQVVAGSTIRLYDKSYGTGEVVVSWTWLVDGVAFSGNTAPFPTLTVPAYVSSGNKTIRLTVTGSNSSTHYVEKSLYYSTAGSSSKPVKTDTFGDISIFIYNTTSATVINRKFTLNQGFLYSSLKFTNSINKAGTATFTVINGGLATAAEKLLLKAETNVAIISGQSVVWSGKILRSEQNVLTLFNSTTTSAMWDIECESDISKMRLQDIESTSLGSVSGSIGKVVSTLVTSTTGINWNGVHDLGLRSNEGPGITYTITDADMYSQLTTLRNVIDFDMRTRLVYWRYVFTALNTTATYYQFDFSHSPYTTEFVGRWMLVCSTGSGVVTYGKCTSASSTLIARCTTMVNPPAAAISGTVIILGDPVLDFVSDLSSTKHSTIKMNAPLSSTYNSGYEFNDKTDKKMLATKVVAKGKTPGGNTIAATIAAVTPWSSSQSGFESSTTITKRTEGTIVALSPGTAATDSTISVEGWGFDYTTLDYLVIKHPYDSARFLGAQAITKITGVPIETLSGTVKVTNFTVHDLGHFATYPTYESGTVFLMKAADFGDKYCRLYIDSISTLVYVDGMDVYIGGETIETIDDVRDPVYGYYLRYLCDGTAKHRDKTLYSNGAHIPGAVVWKESIYDETTPVAGSPVDYHGIILQTYTADQNVSLPILETYATLYLIAYSYYYRKAEFWCFVYDFFKTDVRASTELTCASYLSVGDKISCLPKSTSTEIETEDGQLKNIWQVVSYTLDTNTMQVTVQLGDFERNVFTLLADKTAAINQTIT